MIAQSKGKDKSQVVNLPEDGWHYSIKYDGNYVQISKQGNEVRFFTSGGKEFYLPEIANELIVNNPETNFIIEAEYIGNSLGKLGDRTRAAKLTTYRTEFSKGLTSKAVAGKDMFKVFDLVDVWYPFRDRLELLKTINFGSFCELVSYSNELRFDEIDSEPFRKLGYEGLFLKHKYHMYKPGKRQSTAIKDKGDRNTDDLKCIDVIGGDGKYHGLIGSLVLIDDKGRTVSVGSGMSDFDRQKPYDYYIGKIIEFKYEQILDTYIQPIFICVRDDK